ncbi:MAG: hypothetical protein WC986_11470 [Elusimicrobiota bacterium]|jgi:hypothetical protein
MRNIRTIILLSAACLLTGMSAFAREQFGAFKESVDRDSLRPFTRDLGGILGAASFHSGRPLGFSGFDAGVHGGVQFRPETGDKVLRAAGRGVFGLPWAQGEIGMPFRIDGFIRGVSFQGLTIAGGGLRWGVTKINDKLYAPNLLVSGLAHSVVHKDFSASHFGANLVASINVPLTAAPAESAQTSKQRPTAAPYLGMGVDRTSVVVRAADADPSLVGENVVTLASRFTAGLTIRPWPFFYLQLAYTNAHGQSGMDSGLGLRF